MTVGHRPTWAEVDLGAIEHNARLLTRLASPAKLCAVVKADGYGHGAIECARSAIAGGASSLAVALVEEGLALRAAGIEAPILILSEPPLDAMPEVVSAGLTPTLYRPEGVDAVRRAASGRPGPLEVEVKVDTGMHRVGCDPSDLVELGRSIAEAPELVLSGLWTHLAVADEAGDPFTALQLERFNEAHSALTSAGIEVERLHAANSAGTIAHPDARFNLVRCGIALYGHLPAAGFARLLTDSLGPDAELMPALRLRSQVHLVRDLAAGERPSYGRSYELTSDSRVAVVPIGYADGVSRRLATTGGEVLISGRRRPIAGTVTMDAIIVDCGNDPVAPGDEVILIGRQGTEEITASEWANCLGTIHYEVLCAIGSRVPRQFISSSTGSSGAGDPEGPSGRPGNISA